MTSFCGVVPWFVIQSVSSWRAYNLRVFPISWVWIIAIGYCHQLLSLWYPLYLQWTLFDSSEFEVRRE